MKYPMQHFGGGSFGQLPETQVIDNKKIIMIALGTAALIIGALYLSSYQYMQEAPVKKNPGVNRRRRKKIKKLWSQYESEELPPPIPKDAK